MIRIGVTGPIKHGKSTFIECLQSIELSAQQGESSAVISEVADLMNVALVDQNELPSRANLNALNDWVISALPHSLEQVTGQSFDGQLFAVTSEHIDNEPAYYDKLWQYLTAARGDESMLHERITPINKDRYRSLLQWIGGYVTYKVGRSVWYEELMARADHAEQLGCPLYLIGGVRDPLDEQALRQAGGTLLDIYRPGAPVPDADDPTERQRRLLTPDSTICNNGTLEQLRQLAARILHDASTDALWPSYYAVDNTATSRASHE